MGAMEPSRELIDAIYRDKVLRAREEDPGAKLWDGVRLFEGVCTRMKAGIRARFPEADEEGVRDILLKELERLAQVRQPR